MTQTLIAAQLSTSSIYRLGIGFAPDRQWLDGSRVTAKGLHGVLYEVLRRADRADRTAEAAWLHGHPAPKPYTLVPLFGNDGGLAGIQMTALGDRAAKALTRAWLLAREQGEPLALGRQPFHVRQVELVHDGTLSELVQSENYRTLGLRFVSPTSFRQGPGDLPLPLPRLVFGRPYGVWNSYGHQMELLPSAWLDWCDRSVFVTQLHIETVEVRLSPIDAFIGFVGEVWYEPRGGSALSRRMLAAFGRLAAYVGVGRKTTMGMGAVEFLGVRE